jgi:hypothetical protein
MDLIETIDRTVVDLEHRATDTGVLSFARCPVRTPAVTQLDLTFVEVLLEFGPFPDARRPVFCKWAW